MALGKWFSKCVEYILHVSCMALFLDVYIWDRQVREAFVSNEMKYVRICGFPLKCYTFVIFRDM